MARIMTVPKVKLTARNLAHDPDKVGNLLKQVYLLPVGDGKDGNPAASQPDVFEFDFDAITPEDCVQFRRNVFSDHAELILDAEKCKFARIHILADFDLIEIFNSKDYIGTKNGDLFDEFDDSRIFEYHINLEKPTLANLKSLAFDSLGSSQQLYKTNHHANLSCQEKSLNSTEVHPSIKLSDSKPYSDQNTDPAVTSEPNSEYTAASEQKAVDNLEADFDTHGQQLNREQELPLDVAASQQPDVNSKQDEGHYHTPQEDPEDVAASKLPCMNNGLADSSCNQQNRVGALGPSSGFTSSLSRTNCDTKITLRIPKRQSSCWVYGLALFLRDEPAAGNEGGNFDVSSINDLLQGCQLSQNAERFKSLFENFNKSPVGSTRTGPEAMLSSCLMSSLLLGSTLARASRDSSLPGGLSNALLQSGSSPNTHRTDQPPPNMAALMAQAMPLLQSGGAGLPNVPQNINQLPSQAVQQLGLLSHNLNQLSAEPTHQLESLPQNQLSLQSDQRLGSVPSNQQNFASQQPISVPPNQTNMVPEPPSSQTNMALELRILESEARLKARFVESEAKHREIMAESEARILARLEQMEVNLTVRLDERLDLMERSLTAKLDERLDLMEGRLTAKMEGKLTAKLDDIPINVTQVGTLEEKDEADPHL